MKKLLLILSALLFTFGLIGTVQALPTQTYSTDGIFVGGVNDYNENQYVDAPDFYEPLNVLDPPGYPEYAGNLDSPYHQDTLTNVNWIVTYYNTYTSNSDLPGISDGWYL